MRETNKKLVRNQSGITLIALVITIIVLLILAGVAISMLSGENGILRQAAESKIKTEEGQREEMSSLFSYEMAMDTNSKYKYQHGYLTGFEYDKESNHTVETVSVVEKSLPKGYKIISKYDHSTGKDVPIKEEDKETTYISTGMVIQKDGQEVGRTVLLGDINGDQMIAAADRRIIINYVCFHKGYDLNDYQKAAANICDDKEIDINDVSIMEKYVARHGVNINQKATISNSGKELKTLYTELQEYISLLDEETTGYKFEYNNKTDTYKLKGVKSGTTVQTLISELPTPDKVSIVNESHTTMQPEEQVTDGCYVALTVEYMLSEQSVKTLTPKFAYIEVED